MNMPAHALDPSQRELWARATAQIEALGSNERVFAGQVKRDLLRHPGYYYAAKERTAQRQAQHRNRPHWQWAWQRWAALFAEGGMPAVIKMPRQPLEIVVFAKLKPAGKWSVKAIPMRGR